MLVKDMAFKVLDVLVRKRTAVQRLDLVLHDVAVLFDVVLLVEFLPERDDVLARHIGVGIELGTRSGIGSGDVVPDEVSFLPQVEPGVEFLDVGDRHLLVDGHQTLLYLPPNFTACDFIINVEVFRDGNHHGLWTLFAGRLVGLANTIH